MELKKIEIFDTSFRDGLQQKGMEINDVKKAIELLRYMDKLGVSYAELGFIGVNDFADKLIHEAVKIQSDFSNLKFAAFGRTGGLRGEVKDSLELKKMVEVQIPVSVLVCKARLNDVIGLMGSNAENNMRMLSDSIKFLKENGISEVIVDYEHAVDAFFGRGVLGRQMSKEEANLNRNHLFDLIRVASEVGADCHVLCDTNGGAVPEEINEIVLEVIDNFPGINLGIHCHNDQSMAVANTRVAVLAGVTHVQGVFNGRGERCGNADLISVICRLQLKDGVNIFPEESLKMLTDFSRFHNKIFHQDNDPFQPFVGKRAFYTQAGMHARDIESYCHMDPTVIGNKVLIGVSSHSGVSNLILTAEDIGIRLTKEEAKKLIIDYPHMVENEGFENSLVSFELAILRMRNQCSDFFHTLEYKALTEKDTSSEERRGQGIVRMEVGDKIEYIIADGKGAVDALFNAVKKAIRPYYPEVDNIQLTLYDVHGLGVSDHGSGAPVRVIAQFENGDSPWVTVGVSNDQTDAALRAFVDALRWYLYNKRILKK